MSEGDTIRSIAAEYSLSISTILASNKLENPDLIVAGQDLIIPPVEGLIADVQAGETLATLAARLGADPLQVALANGLEPDVDQIIPYEKLLVPGLEPAERVAGIPHRRESSVLASARASDGSNTKLSAMSYEVQEGDTLAQLSAQFGVSVWTILTANNLSDPDLLRPGMSLKVPTVNGVEHEVQPGESLVDIAAYYEVDLGPLIDFNAINDPDALSVGMRLVIPGADKIQPGASLASLASGPTVASLPAPSVRSAVPSGPLANPVARTPQQTVAASQRPAVSTTLAAARPPAPVAAAKPQAAPAAARAAAPATTAQAPARVQASAISAPIPVGVSGSGGGVVGNAMRYLGARYVFGGTSPAGFDCSGFVWYVHKAAGRPVSRGLWGQLNGGPRVSMSQLQPGDTVFFANTYMPGLSHSGIYLGGGRFIHASDEQSGVKISSLSDGYWAPRYIGASRLW